MHKILLVILGLVFSQISFAECTPRPGQSSATFAQVMYHFGKATRIGGTVGRKGTEDVASVTHEMIQEAIDAIQVALECADLSMNATTNDLLPKKAETLTGPAREQYLIKYKGHLQNFISALAHFKAMFCEALLAMPDATGFQMMRDQELFLMDLANEAHEDLK